MVGRECTHVLQTLVSVIVEKIVTSVFPRDEHFLKQASLLPSPVEYYVFKGMQGFILEKTKN